MKTQVVPESEIEDPLLRDPIRIAGIDYVSGRLIFRLSSRPNAEWIRAFQNQPSEHFIGWEPHRFQFHGDAMSVHEMPSVNGNQQLANNAKRYVEAANGAYANFIRTRHQADLDQRRRALREQVAAEEKRRQIIESIKI